MPTTGSIPDIGVITSQPCSYPDNSGVDASPALTAAAGSSDADEANRLFELERQVQDVKAQINTTITSIEHWFSMFQSQSGYRDIVDYVRRQLRLSLVKHADLSTEQNSRLHVLMHLSHFARFLIEQENDPAYGDKTSQLTSLRVGMLQAACVLRNLLPTVSNELIQRCAEEELTNKRIHLQDQHRGIKRIVTYAVLDTMKGILMDIQISEQTRSVTMTHV